ncbi:uncharacterized protein [Cardiocondyla obscurior]|uniref:uncharacterized protein n=1 Tax=Cardiocondyla obscurior TaxID=286306 RepID=UPI00396576A9
MPNLKGPNRRIRKLYVNVVQSMITYGSPIFAKDVTSRNKKSERTIRQILRNLAIRQARCYRTVSHNAATLLAGSPFLNFVMKERAGRYQIIQEWKDRGIYLSVVMRSRLKERGLAIILSSESFKFSPATDASEGTCTVLERKGSPSVITVRPEKTTEHTVMECPAFNEERQELVSKIGSNLRLDRIIQVTMENKEKEETFATFCEKVMLQKENDERVRRGEVTVLPSYSDCDDNESLPLDGSTRLLNHLMAFQ